MTCSLGYYDVNYCEINIANPYIALYLVCVTVIIFINRHFLIHYRSKLCFMRYIDKVTNQLVN